MPVQAAPDPVVVCTLGDLEPKLLNPTVHCGPINNDPSLGQQVPDVGVGQWKPTIPANGKKDDVSRIPVSRWTDRGA